MANTTQKQAAKQFAKDWMGKGYEKGETQRFGWSSCIMSLALTTRWHGCNSSFL